MMVRTFLALLFAISTAAIPPVSATEPLDCTEAMSTVEMNNCAGAEFEKADRELNEVYAHALKAIPDMATDDPMFDAKAWENALRQSQRAWLAFRDAECEDHVAMFWSGGSGGTVDIIGCKTEKTEARIKDLKARYEDN